MGLWPSGFDVNKTETCTYSTVLPKSINIDRRWINLLLHMEYKGITYTCFVIYKKSNILLQITEHFSESNLRLRAIPVK